MYRSSQGALYRAMHSRLVREDVQVGGGAGYPRVEIHTFSEGAALDKGGLTRQVTCIVESMSTRGMGDAVQMNADNLGLLLGEPLDVEGFFVTGVTPGTLTDMTESMDTKEILYRILQTFTVTLTQK